MAPPSMNSWEQPDHEEALQNFHSLINRSLFEGKAANPDFCKFCPEGVLRHYFEEFHHQNLRRLLKAVLYTQNAPHRELPTKDILGKEHSYVLIFAILLRIGQGRLIRHFSQHTSLCDTYLPFTAMPSAFPGALRQQEIFKDFRAMQWQFCPARMDSRQIAIWEEERILPIHTMEPIGKGGSADTFRIQIHDQYNKMDIGSNQRQGEPDHEYFVLKRYKPPFFQDDYENELNAFRFISNQSIERESLEAFIGFYGSYVHDNVCYIVLEYANEGTLETMFREVVRPSTALERILAIQSLFGLTKALKILHATRLRSPDNTMYEYQGFHNDIKPDNILRKSKPGNTAYESLTKLADFGLSHFQRKIGTNALGLDAQGTRVYGAPECYYPERLDRQLGRHITNKVDIWSLGCVFLEFLVWMAGGFASLENFRNQRRDETQAKSRFEDVQAFHDGKDVLKCVQERMLSFKALKHDGLICKVASMVEKMLSVNADDRPPATSIYEECTNILSNANRAVKSPDEPISVPPTDFHDPPYWPSQTRAQQEQDFPNRQRRSENLLSSATTPISPSHSAPKEVRVLSYKAARFWLEECRAKRFWQSRPTIEHFDQLHQIKDRDHVFLLDNSESMHEHWPNVRESVELLCEILFARKADNRIDVQLAMGDKNLNSSRVSHIVKYVREHPPGRGPGSADASIEYALGKVLRKFLEDLKHRRNSSRTRFSWSNIKPLSLYILTNGSFPYQDDVGAPIRDTIKDLQQMGLLTGFIGIQFVRFGEDPEGIQRLEYLDNLEDGRWDMVDTEKWD